MATVEDWELEEAMIYWFEHFDKNGYRHVYGETSWEKVVELYFEEALDKTLNDLPEMSDEENDAIIDRINKMF